MKFPGNIFYYLRVKNNRKLSLEIRNLFHYDQKTDSSGYVADYRKELINCKNILTVRDKGAGSKNMKSCDRLVSDIVKKSSTSEKFGVLYQKIIDTFNVSSVLELGTSLGVGTMYFALAGNKPNVVTIEACEETFNFTLNNFQSKGINNVKFVNDDFDNVFNENLLLGEKFDMIFIDGNHKSESVLFYFDYISKNIASKNCIYIIDDINWTSDMYKAWKIIKKKKPKNLALNVGRVGLLFDSFADMQDGDFPINFVK